MHVTAVKGNVILPAVNAARQDRRVIRGRQDLREPKEMSGAPVLKVTEAIRDLWVRRGFPALPEQGAKRKHGPGRTYREYGS